MAKFLSLSIWKGRRVDTISFQVSGERIPVHSEQPIRSFGREYSAELTDKHMATTVITQLKDGLKRTDQSYLSGKYKLWCYQFTLY